MKIAISTSGNNLEAAVDPRFGRAAGFIICDTETGKFEYIDNKQNLQAMQGAGIQAAKTVVDSGAKAVITGHCGPKAFMTLKSAGIAIYTGAAGTGSEMLDKFKRGELAESHQADVQGHW